MNEQNYNSLEQSIPISKEKKEQQQLSIQMIRMN